MLEYAPDAAAALSAPCESSALARSRQRANEHLTCGLVTHTGAALTQFLCETQAIFLSFQKRVYTCSHLIRQTTSGALFYA